MEDRDLRVGFEGFSLWYLFMVNSDLILFDIFLVLFDLWVVDWVRLCVDVLMEFILFVVELLEWCEVCGCFFVSLILCLVSWFSELFVIVFVGN